MNKFANVPDVLKGTSIFRKKLAANCLNYDSCDFHDLNRFYDNHGNHQNHGSDSLPKSLLSRNNRGFDFMQRLDFQGIIINQLSPWKGIE